MTYHHKYGPSAAHRYMACPLSVVLEDGAPDDVSPYATEGTAVHALAELALNGKDPYDFVNQEIEGVEITEEHAESVAAYATMVNNLRDVGDTLFVEQFVDFGDAVGCPGAGGTADVGIISEGGTRVIVIDRKYKWGKKVSAVDNVQLKLYALGFRQLAYDAYDEPPKEYTFVVHQWDDAEDASMGYCTDEELMAFAAKAATAIRRCEWAFHDRAVGYPLSVLAERYGEAGEAQCRYCKGKAVCPVLKKTVNSLVPVSVTAGTADCATVVAKVKDAELEDLANWKANLHLIEAFAEAVSKRVHAELTAGNKVPGFKLVEGKAGNRKWVDEEEVKTFLKGKGICEDDIYESKIVTPAQAEKLFKGDKAAKAELDNLTKRADPKPVVAPEADKRPEYQPQLDFEAIEDDD